MANKRINMKRAKKKRAAKGELALRNKRKAGASAISVDEKVQNINPHIEVAEGHEEKASSKPEEHKQGTYRKLLDACTSSKHLTGQLTSQRSALLIQLPAALPSALVIRALNKDAQRYKVLSVNHIAAVDSAPNQLELMVNGMREEQLPTLIEELDELIGEFTARS